MRGIAALMVCGMLSGCGGAEAGSACAAPLAGWRTTANGLPPETFVINRVQLGTSNQLRWNGVPIDRQTLQRYLLETRDDVPVPFVILDPGPSPDCAFLDAVRNEIETAYQCRRGECGEGSGAWPE